VSAPHFVAQRIFSTSSSIDDATALLPMFGVDLYQKIPADDHRLAFGVIDVRRDDCAAPRDLTAHNSGVISRGIFAPKLSPACC